FASSCMNLKMFGVEVDPDQIQSSNSIFILILLPLMTVLFTYLQGKGYKILPTDKMKVGFLLTAVCMGIMALAALLAGTPELRPTVAIGEMTVHIPGPDGYTLKGEMELKAEDDVIVVSGKKKVLVSKDGKEWVAKGSTLIPREKKTEFLKETVKIEGEGIRFT